MQKQHKFSAKTKMSDLIEVHYSLLWVITRFGISLGFGNKTVEEVCTRNDINTQTFLSVVNFLGESNFDIENGYENISVEILIRFLKNGHTYFLEYKLPTIREKLLLAIEKQEESNSYKNILLNFFDDYVQEVRKHMEYEDKVVFPYIYDLLNNKPHANYCISIFESKHDEIESKLTELKSILIKYYPSKENNYLLTEVLSDILLCKKDLSSHNLVEDYMLIPAIKKMEKQLNVEKIWNKKCSESR